jgi:hypothetical protein
MFMARPSSCYPGPVEKRVVAVLQDMEVASTSYIMLRTHPRLGSPQNKSKSTRRALAPLIQRNGNARYFQ